jgi:cyclic beta-1,2-glucan synthetase
MSSPSIAIDPSAVVTCEPLTGARTVNTRLSECASRLRQHVRRLQSAEGERSPAAALILDNHAFIQFQIRDVRLSLPASYLRKMPKMKDGNYAGELRIYRLAADLAADSTCVIDLPMIGSFAQSLQSEKSLRFVELWAFGSMLKLVIIQQLCGALGQEAVVSAAISSLRTLENASWRDFVESVSQAEKILRQDPARIYSRTDFATRDQYRHVLEKLARQTNRGEEEVAQAALECASEAKVRNDPDDRKSHVGYYLIGAGLRDLWRRMGCRRPWHYALKALAERWPSSFYVGGISAFTALIALGLDKAVGPLPFWMIALLLLPASQAAIELVNTTVSRLLRPRPLPVLDFPDGIPDDCRTLVVVPTLMFSPQNVAKLLEDLEIRYLANRSPNLYFALLTDFVDADFREIAGDSVLNVCADGIRRLNSRYGNRQPGPFYLFHRARQWNSSEKKWIGFERKRGKLNDLNKLLLGAGNQFDTVVGDMEGLRDIRFVITLDTDTQLPRDSAAKMIGAAAHPLNRPILDAKTNMVREGYGLLRPHVSISMESAGRSRLAQIFSGQAGFDPYATMVSDVYQDLSGQASFTGKGIYHLRVFDQVVGDRFPENNILSHDLIEGEHVRTGLLTSADVVEDYPTSYQAFSKRKHRWVRGDWQLLPWLLPKVPAPGGKKVANPLSPLSRWKLFDNLRRSLFEISVLCLLVAGWFLLAHPVLWTVAIFALLQVPAYVDILLSAVKAPERRFLSAFIRNLGERFLASHGDTVTNIIFIPHQAFLMADAIVRTLVRRLITGRHLLEWETMAQAQAASGMKLGMVERYLYLSTAVWIVFLLSLSQIPILIALICSLWIVAPLMVAWLNEPLPLPTALSVHDRAFLRDVALRTWRFFADYSKPETHFLVPDNIQEDPPLETHRISPTNLGLLLTSHLAAHDFGYVTTGELTQGLQRVFTTMEEMPRYRGHFMNWYETESLAAPAPHYVSSVDSGNLAASLTALRHGCLSLLKRPIIGSDTLEGLRDHAYRVRDELPYNARTISVMRLLASLLRHLDCEPVDLFYWESILTEARDTVQRIREMLVPTHVRLERQGEQARSDELRYWENLLAERVGAAVSELFRLAPWLDSALEPELRVNMRDPSFAALFHELSPVPALSDLPATYKRIQGALIDRLHSSAPLYPALRAALEQLYRRLMDAQAFASSLVQQLEKVAADAARFFDEMHFRFLFDERRKVLRIGYNIDNAHADEAGYDLLASEARTSVFLAIAKGDIPRDAWFKLGRKITGYCNRRSLISWSGTMFEYLMPLLHMRNYSNTLLDHGMRGAVEIQQIYAQQRKVPWGISESAHSARDTRFQYQYHAFGVPALSARSDRACHLVIAPYASMLALMVDPSRSTANLRSLAAQHCLARYGFFESVDFSVRGVHAPEFVRCFMAHHQGMGLAAIDNVLLGNRMQERFHLDPLIQATEFLLQERMPALVEVFPEADPAAA